MRGRITVRAHIIEEDRDGAALRLEVADEGISISSGQQSRLFHAFVQADGSTSRQYGSTGLGLIISKRLAVLMGGDAGVDSAIGKGSTFWATARLKQWSGEEMSIVQADSEAGNKIQAQFAGRRVLVVEDEPFNQESAQYMLEDVGLAVDLARNGKEAVALAHTHVYALILMDMQMPIMDGLESTRAIRLLPNNANIPILALTLDACVADRIQCLEAGMNDHIGKPVNKSALYTTLLHRLKAAEEPEHA